MFTSVLAAPILQKPEKMPDELRALGRIRKVGLRVGLLDDYLQDIGIGKKDLLDPARAVLEQSGFEPVEEETTPRIDIKSITMRNGRYEGAVGFVIFIDFVQRARVLRLDTDLNLPTATLPCFGLVDKDDLKERIRTEITSTIKYFVEVERKASKTW
ncbi:MAG: hypothetical protein CMJ18_05850 [Phycisphaeraceae bacterium]|nr:hypothetical protein [Phycisphaeraceae bacterium]